MANNAAKLFRYLKSESLSPTNKALSLTIGFYLGIFPVFGVTTVLCLSVLLFLRLNPVLMLTINWLVAPLQFLLIYPFLKTGRLIFFNDKQVLPDLSVKAWLNADSWDTFYHLIESVIGGIAVWGIVSVGSAYFLFRIFLKITAEISRDY